MEGNAVNTDDMVKSLEMSGDYRVLRRLKPRDVFEAIIPGQELQTGVLIDLETTGLDTTSDEVIELGLVKFAYLADDRLAHVVDTLGAFNEPSKPIPSEVTELTGITTAMVAGHRIDPNAVTEFISDAKIVIAHNAAFDRPIAGRYWPQFKDMAWACSATKSNGARRDLRDHVWFTCWPRPACFTKPIAQWMIAERCLKSWLRHSRELRNPR
jgi:DNA polymerase-3 subunit epsilon